MRVYRIDLIPANSIFASLSLTQGVGVIINNPTGIRVEFEAQLMFGGSSESGDKNSQFIVSLYNVEQYWVSQMAQNQGLVGMKIIIWGGLADTPTSRISGVSTAKSDNVLFGEPLLSGFVNMALSDVNGRDTILRLVIHPNPTKFNPADISFSVKKGENYKAKVTQAFLTITNNYQSIKKLTFTQKAQVAQQAGTCILERGMDTATQILVLNRFLNLINADSVSLSQNTPLTHVLTKGDLIGQPEMIDHNSVQFTAVLNSKYHVGDYIIVPQLYFVGLTKNLTQYSDVNRVSPISTIASMNNGAFSFFSGNTWLVNIVTHRGRSTDVAPESWVTFLQCTKIAYENAQAIINQTSLTGSQSAVIINSNTISAKTGGRL